MRRRPLSFAFGPALGVVLGVWAAVLWDLIR